VIARVSGPRKAFRQNFGTHLGYLLQVARCVNLHHLDCNVEVLVFALPDVGEPALARRCTRSIVANWDLQRSWNQCLSTTYFAQNTQTHLLMRWRQRIQCLLGKIRMSDLKLLDIFFLDARIGKYLIYHIDKVLGIFPT
jgi:hypothetical protein